jgi:hypothetical protein
MPRRPAAAHAPTSALIVFALLAPSRLALASQSETSTGLSRDERVLLPPAAAALSADGRHWQVPVRITVYEPELDDPLRAAVLAPLRELLDVERGSPEAERFVARASLFFVDHERRKRV